ncbi:MAG TPA: peptide-N4-asparagine amidase [Candidatus Dormibacteraeota bacterium]|nr:peptide-N4-asparagine amidase [Candidatus Dormibacteraeota bacterium]
MIVERNPLHKLYHIETRSKILSVSLILVIFTISLLTIAPVRATAETGYENPVTAAPPLVPPTTRSCTVTLAQTQPFPIPGGNGYDTPLTGTLSPPSSCPAPWSMVVLNFTGSVTGRQFDREAMIWIGNAMVYMGTTPEPTPAGITWHAIKDVSEYTPLLTQGQTYTIQVPNLVNSRFTGTIYITATLTFYETSSTFTAASHPDTIVPLSGSFLFLPGRTPVSAKPVTLPTNPDRLFLELWAKGNSCDEFWYASQPDAYANANGLCPGGAFREIQVSIDNTLAGVVWPFPYVFTGGINPYLWRPIPAVDAFNEPPYLVDLTPFIGMLTDGQPHTVSFNVVNNGFYWQIDGNLLVYRDPVLAKTSGKLTTYQINPGTAQSVSQTINTNSALFNFISSRSLAIAGYVDTSAGRVTTSISQQFTFTNNQVLDLINFLENLKGTETITATTTTTGPSGTSTLTVADSYPIAMTSMFQIPGALAASGNPSTLKFILPATVDQSFTRTTTTNNNGQISTSNISDTVHSEAILVRSLTTGVNAVASGTDREHYILSDSTGACFNHLITAAQGFLTSDTFIPTC